MADATRDPRSIITPDALEVSTDLFGMQLATPRRRAAALTVDGLVIVLITAMTNNFSLILGVIAGAFFIRAGFKRTPVRGSVFGRAMRFSVGCLGVVIALVTVGLWTVFGPDLRGDRANTGEAVASLGQQVANGLAAAGLFDDIDLGETGEDAVEMAEEIIEAGRALGATDDQLRGVLLAALPDGAPWAAGWVETVEALLAGEEVGVVDDGEARDRVDDLSDGEALRAFANDVVESDGETDPAYDAALRERLIHVVAPDTLDELEDRVGALSGQNAALRGDLAAAREELQTAESRGLRDRLFDFLDELGFGFGWAAIYLTIIMSWWNGQTVGKRMFGIRVVRLDGEPITWWVAFERAGGYAAGLFTGFLGFAQVWWDANRQAIHDRIVGTVVVREGAEKVIEWEEAL